MHVSNTHAASSLANTYRSLGNSVNNKQDKSNAVASDGEDGAKNNAATDASKKELSKEEQTQVAEMKQRDQEVRAHEAAHKAAAGQYAKGGASFEYKRGPDGQLYAVGGEVSIDAGSIPNNPEATLQKANQIRSAALAPAQPSAQDRAVAAAAGMMATEAQAEIAKQNLEQGDAATQQYDEVAKLDPDKEEPGLDLHA